MKKIAIILSGCGNKDGSEITESISLIIALSKIKIEYCFFAPNIEMSPKNFITNVTLSEKRNILIESARIARGNIKDIKDLNLNDFDALVFPGGSGAAKYLCDWSTSGAKCEVLPSVQKAILEFNSKKRPIAAICIAPVLLARVLGSKGVLLTIGNDQQTIAEIQKTGAHHVECSVIDCVVDAENKILTTPAYMYDTASPYEVFQGISKLVVELIEMI